MVVETQGWFAPNERQRSSQLGRAGVRTCLGNGTRDKLRTSSQETLFVQNRNGINEKKGDLEDGSKHKNHV
jgi:hypothetical protein